jgi:tetratricopeptide (TPR) repeat protein
MKACNVRITRILILAAAMSPCFIYACAGSGTSSVRDLVDSGWTEARKEVDTRMISLLERDEYEEAIRLADSAEAAGVDDPRIKGQKAEALGRTGRIDEAVALFEESLLADYAVCETHLNFAVLLLETGRTGRALTELNEAKMFCGQENMPVISRNLAVARIKSGHEDEALGAVEEGLEYAPGDPYLLGLKGMLVAEANPILAETLFVRSERAGGMTPDFQYQFGLLMLRNNQPGRAVRPLEGALAGDPANREILYNYAEALARSGRSEDAESVLRDMLDEEWEDRVGRRLARLFFGRGDYSEALELFRRLPETPENRDRVAMCLHRLGRSREAIMIQKKVVEERPDWPTGMINLAVMLAAEGELDEAERHLVRALELDPDNVTATVNLESLRRAGRGETR